MVGFWPPETGEEGVRVPVCTLTEGEEGPGSGGRLGCEGGAARRPSARPQVSWGPSGRQDAETGSATVGSVLPA